MKYTNADQNETSPHTDIFHTCFPGVYCFPTVNGEQTISKIEKVIAQKQNTVGTVGKLFIPVEDL